MFEDAFLVVRWFCHEFLCKFLNRFGSIFPCCLCIVLSQKLNNSCLSIVHCVSQRSFALLILDANKPSALFEQVVTDFELTISACKMKGSVPKLVLSVCLAPLVAQEDMQNLFTAHLGRYENCSLVKFVLSVRVDVFLQQIRNHLWLIALGCIVKQALSKAVRVVQLELGTFGFNELDDVDQPELGCVQHGVSA